MSVNEYEGVGKNIKESSTDVLDKIQEFIFPSEFDVEGTGYERNLLDRRIEKYLDQHFDEYVEEFGLVRELDIEVLEERVDYMVESIKDIDDFQKDAEAELMSLKRRLDKIEENKI